MASVAVDQAGNLYIADPGSHSVRMVNAATGIITMIAGGGSGCAGQTDLAGDGCAATSAQLMTPAGIGLDVSGNLYIADTGSGLIRMVNAATDVMTTVAQSGPPGSGIVGVPASTLLQEPVGVAVDAAGDVYITDEGTERILKFESATGGIFTDAGNGTIGYSGDGGLATSAQLDVPTSVALDTAGNVYFSERNNNVIRMVSASGAPLVFPQTNVGSGSATQTTIVTNTGNSPLSFMFYLSTDGKTKGSMLNYRSVAALAAGASSTATTSMTLPTSITGTNYVLVRANNSNSPVVETNTANDCTASRAMVITH
jgi:hypothetical protein